MANVKKNYLFNLAFQGLNFLTPLIVTPYISRVLGATGVGQYAFTYSLITYFVIFAAFGFNIYAQREIAREQGNKAAQSKVFWEVVIARGLTVLLSLSANILLILLNAYKEYTALMCLLSINILAAFFDITFFFQGNEKFGTIALFGIVSKVIGIACIFIFVKNESHVWLYALCQTVILSAPYIFLWLELPKFLVKIKSKELNIRRHFVPSLKLFIPTIAVSVYTILDRTLLGVMITGADELGRKYSEIENGFYEQSEKVAKMAMMIITSLGTVMIPRNSQAVAAGDINGFKSNITGALRFVFFLGTPIMLGLAAVANNLSPWFFGEGYEKVPSLIMLFSSLVMIIGLSNVLGIQYLLPLKQDKKYTIAIISGAGVNFVLNIFLIPSLWSHGACLASLIAEMTVTIIMFVYARKDISFGKMLSLSWKYILSGIVMFFVVFFSQRYLSPSIWNTVLLVFEGVICYMAVLLFTHDAYFISFCQKAFNRFFRKTDY